MLAFRRWLANLPCNRRWALELAMSDPEVGGYDIEGHANRLLIYRFRLDQAR